MNSTNSTNPNHFLLTIDVEEWFQVENLRPLFPPTHWSVQESRVEYSTYRLLDLFDSFQFPVKATFFVLGWIAEKYPQLIREIKNSGHEIASHGCSHLLLNQIEPENLLPDLKKSKEILESITGEKVSGYRAPNFSIDDVSLQLIKQSGYTYDSSYNSFDKHGRYGRISTNGYQKDGIAISIDQNFHELPISNLKIANQTIPWGGGGYFRLLPPAIYNAGVQRHLNNKGAYLFYMHPWEIDPRQPRVKTTNTWRHYLNLNKTYTRLKNMITRFHNCTFTTCTQYIAQTTKNPNPINSTNPTNSINSTNSTNPTNPRTPHAPEIL
jgi:polysaccharide deacetylase family protein (PEP-CTERM system associated)